ncbi:hypothetical protein AB1N83_003475 [Pleurotus pulmonarius]|nr:hypothetical protein EYR36_009215 [Pleurotus pulmonarius]KAF4592715.1 hypothetical protein EYR38_008415 [Pleurotus pulmonarius]
MVVLPSIGPSAKDSSHGHHFPLLFPSIFRVGTVQRMAFLGKDLDVYPQQRLLVIWIEIFAYGVYFVLFSICIYLFRHRRKPHPWVGIATVLLFLLATLKLALDLAVIVKGFVPVQSSAPFYPFNTRLDPVAAYVYVTASGVSDALLIYRCSVVWDHKKLVLIVPILLALASAATGYLSQYVGLMFIVLSMATNLAVTCLIVGRIFWMARRIRAFLGPAHSQYTGAVAIIVESGLLSTVSMAFIAGTSQCDTARWAAYYLGSQAIGIAPTLILVRVGLGAGTYEESMKTLEFAAKTGQSQSVAQPNTTEV